jgi:putative ABC transport system permease protein
MTTVLASGRPRANSRPSVPWPVPTVLRRVRHRLAANLLMAVVAVVAAATAAAGPAYYAAAQGSILADTVSTAPALGRAVEVVESGSLAGLVEPLAAQTTTALQQDAGRAVAGVFAPAIEALEGTAVYAAAGEGVPLVWRSGECAHLVIRGACPSAPGQVLISSSLAATNHWREGQRIAFNGWGLLKVTGIYAVPDVNRAYWTLRATNYFGHEFPSGGFNGPVQYDAMFTLPATLEQGLSNAQGDAVIDDFLRPRRLTPGVVGALDRGVTRLGQDPIFGAENATVTSDIAQTTASVQAQWHSLAVPVVIITIQVVLLAWLLLFVLVVDSADARGSEIALAKLRGYRWWRVLGLGLSEPLVILAAALPLGALAGWGATALLGGALLRPGTPVGMPGLGWLAAAAGIAGGLVAVTLAARRTLRRSVVDQWRRAGRHSTERGWVLDVLLVAGAAAGLVELVTAGAISSTGGRVLSLLVPGLIGVAVAVVASRLLPLACRWAAVLTSRKGGIGSFLALRQVGRRPGGTRTTMLLATSFALATFALSAWLVASANYSRVATARTGAPVVLDVSVPPGANLAATVDAADPGGRQAAAVEEIEANGQTTLAVQPRRFARVATFAGIPLERRLAMAAALDPPAPPPVTVSGDGLRVAASTEGLGPLPAELIADVLVPTGGAPTPVDLGRLPAAGRATLMGALTGCPCVLVDLQASLVSFGRNPPTEAGTVVIGGIQDHAGGRWMPVLSKVAAAWRWRPSPPDTVSVGSNGYNLVWKFHTPADQNPTLTAIDRPEPLPALAAAGVTGGHPGSFTAVGLDGGDLPTRVVSLLGAVPGAPAGGVVVDGAYADLAAGGDTAQAADQVWVTVAARDRVEAALAARHVKVTSVVTEASADARLSRQGPALATVLFLGDAVAGAALAAVGAVAGLFSFARRRRYEYAALLASGVRRPVLRRSLLVEQAIVLGFGTLVGIAAGVAAVAVALRSVPEFTAPPAAPALSYVPPVGSVAAILAAMVALLIAVAAVAGGGLVSEVATDQLREAPE